LYHREVSYTCLRIGNDDDFIEVVQTANADPAVGLSLEVSWKAVGGSDGANTVVQTFTFAEVKLYEKYGLAVDVVVFPAASRKLRIVVNDQLDDGLQNTIFTS